MLQLTIPSTFQIFSKKSASSDAAQQPNAVAPSTTISEFIHTVIPLTDRTESYDVVNFMKPFYKNQPHAAIFRAQLIRDSDSTSHSTQDAVVCKILRLPEDPDDISSLEREARIYQKKLVGLQGQCVPRFIGFFRWTDRFRGFECLITTWEGESPVDVIPWQCDVTYRSRILDAVLAIHRAGVKHNDLEDLPKNILIKDTGKVFVVDFGESSEHQCELPPDYQFKFHTIYPGLGDLGCVELLDVANSLEVWYPDSHRFLGRCTIPMDEVLKGRKSLIEFVRNAEVESFSEDQLSREADEAIKNLQAWIDGRKTYDGDVPLSIAPE
ncbi:hypothetical protein C8Q78DRAFT_548740 [Trametes maxima]|nr:hypothetical protein C8Q78DRAFT_548740 [Trametes maxima]